MRLVLLGTGGYRPNDRRHTMCLMLPECGIVLDAGTGFYRVGQYAVTAELDILLTHAHLDHVVGLTYLFDVLRQHPLRRVTVHAEADKLAALDEHLLAAAIFPAKLPCEFRALGPSLAMPCGARVRYFPLKHPSGTVGYRLDFADRSLAYVTDTTATDDAAYAEAVRGVDLLVHECSYADGDADARLATSYGHSVAGAVARLARRAQVGRLLLVHINPQHPQDDPVGLASVRAVFPGAELGEDRMEIRF